MTVSYRFCPACGSNLAYRTEMEPTLLAIPSGAFDYQDRPAPTASFNERRPHGWALIVGDSVVDLI